MINYKYIEFKRKKKMKAITKLLSEITNKAFAECGYEGDFGGVRQRILMTLTASREE